MPRVKFLSNLIAEKRKFPEVSKKNKVEISISAGKIFVHFYRWENKFSLKNSDCEKQWYEIFPPIKIIKILLPRKQILFLQNF